MSLERFRRRLVCADKGRSVVVDGKRRNGDLWVAGSLVRTMLLLLMVKTD